MLLLAGKMVTAAVELCCPPWLLELAADVGCGRARGCAGHSRLTQRSLCRTCRVGFYGKLDGDKWVPDEEVIAEAYDVPIPG